MSLLWAGATKNVLILETSSKFKPLGFLCDASPQVLEVIRMILHANIYHTITQSNQRSNQKFIQFSSLVNFCKTTCKKSNMT